MFVVFIPTFVLILSDFVLPGQINTVQVTRSLGYSFFTVFVQYVTNVKATLAMAVKKDNLVYHGMCFQEPTSFHA